MACYSFGCSLLPALLLLAAYATANELVHSNGSTTNNATSTIAIHGRNNYDNDEEEHDEEEHDDEEDHGNDEEEHDWNDYLSGHEGTADWNADHRNSSDHWNFSEHGNSEHDYHGNEDTHGLHSSPEHDGSEHWSSDHGIPNSSEHLWLDHGYHGNEEEEHDWKSWPEHSGNEHWHSDHWNSSEPWNTTDDYYGHNEEEHDWNNYSWSEHKGAEHWNSDFSNSSGLWNSWSEHDGSEHGNGEDWHSLPQDEAQGYHSMGEPHLISWPEEEYDCPSGKVKRFGGRHRLLRRVDAQAEESPPIECVKDDGLALWKIVGIAGAGLMATSLCGVIIFCLCRKSSSKPSLATSGAAVAIQNVMVEENPALGFGEQQV